jgi:hypothetical protein
MIVGGDDFMGSIAANGTVTSADSLGGRPPRIIAARLEGEQRFRG